MGADYPEYLGTDVALFDAGDSWGDIDVRQLLEESQAREQEQLEQELAQIEQQLDEREQIHGEIVSDLEWKLDRYTDRLEHLYTIGKGRLDGTREQIKDRIEEFYRELREEHREHWQDRQQLEHERRAVRRELEAATDESISDFL